MSLVELLVAVAFTAAIILAAGGATLGAIQANRMSENQAIATAIAVDVLECVRVRVASGNPAVGCMPTAAGLPAGFSAPQLILSPPEAILAPEVAVPGMISARTTVSWNRPRPGVVTLRTLIDRPPQP